MAPSSLAAALLQGTLLCSYFCSSVRQGFQITSKEVFFRFKSVFGQWYPCCEMPVCSQKWKSRAVWLHSSFCDWSSFSRKGCSPVLTTLDYLRCSFSQPCRLAWALEFLWTHQKYLFKPNLLVCCCYFPFMGELQNIITFLFLQVSQLSPAFINAFAASRSPSCCSLGRGCVCYHPSSQKLESNVSL